MKAFFLLQAVKRVQKQNLYSRIEYAITMGKPELYDFEIVMYKLQNRIHEATIHFSKNSRFVQEDSTNVGRSLIHGLATCKDETSVIGLINQQEAYGKFISLVLKLDEHKSKLDFNEIRLAIFADDTRCTRVNYSSKL